MQPLAMASQAPPPLTSEPPHRMTPRGASPFASRHNPPSPRLYTPRGELAAGRASARGAPLKPPLTKYLNSGRSNRRPSPSAASLVTGLLQPTTGNSSRLSTGSGTARVSRALDAISREVNPISRPPSAAAPADPYGFAARCASSQRLRRTSSMTSSVLIIAPRTHSHTIVKGRPPLAAAVPPPRLSSRCLNQEGSLPLSCEERSTSASPAQPDEDADTLPRARSVSTELEVLPPPPAPSPEVESQSTSHICGSPTPELPGFSELAPEAVDFSLSAAPLQQKCLPCNSTPDTSREGGDVPMEETTHDEQPEAVTPLDSSAKDDPDALSDGLLEAGSAFHEDGSTFSSSTGSRKDSSCSSRGTLMEECFPSDFTGHSPITPRLRLRIQNQQRVDRQRRRRRSHPMSRGRLRHCTVSQQSSFSSSLTVSGEQESLPASCSSILAPLSGPDNASEERALFLHEVSDVAALSHTKEDTSPVPQAPRLSERKAMRKPGATAKFGSSAAASSTATEKSPVGSAATGKWMEVMPPGEVSSPTARAPKTPMSAIAKGTRNVNTPAEHKSRVKSTAGVVPLSKSLLAGANRKTEEDGTVAKPKKCKTTTPAVNAKSLVDQRPSQQLAASPSVRQSRSVTTVAQSGELTSAAAPSPFHPVKQVLIPLLATPQEKDRTVTVVFDLDETLCNNRVLGPALLRPGASKVLAELRAMFPSPNYKPIPRLCGGISTVDRLHQGKRRDSVEGTVTCVGIKPRRPAETVSEEEGLRLEIVLWTASVEQVARSVVERLDPEKKIFDQKIFRDVRWYTNYRYTKDLRYLGRSMNRVVIVENAPASVELNRGHAILIKDFISDRADRQLFVVKAILAEWIAKCHELLLRQTDKLLSLPSDSSLHGGERTGAPTATPECSRNNCDSCPSPLSTDDGGESLTPTRPSAEGFIPPTARLGEKPPRFSERHTKRLLHHPGGTLLPRSVYEHVDHPLLTLEEHVVITNFLKRHRYMSAQSNFVREMATVEVMAARSAHFASQKAARLAASTNDMEAFSPPGQCKQ